MENVGQINIRNKTFCLRKLDPTVIYHTSYQSPRLGNDFVSAERVIAAIDDFDARGIRVILLTLESRGGSSEASFRMYERLRRFSCGGGTVVTFLSGTVGSAATILGVAGDFVIMSPDAKYVAHGPIMADNRSPDELNAAMVAVFLARTVTSRKTLEMIHAAPEELYEFLPEDAVRHGWADAIGTEEDARTIASRIASGVRISPSKRGRAIAGRTEPVPCHPYGEHFSEARPTPFLHGDAMTLTEPKLGLLNHPVRITSVEEDPTGLLRIEAEDWLYGVAHAVPVSVQVSDGVEGNSLAPWPVLPGSFADLLPLAALGSALSNWTKHSLSGDMTGLSFGGASKGFVAVGYSSAGASSPDGITWTARTLPSGDFYAVTFGAGLFVAVGAAGASGACATSSDGSTWTSRTIPAGSYRAITWNGSLFVAVGASGACATSADGLAWTAQSIVSNSYNGIAWAANPGVFIAVGQSGACSLSTDAIHWVSRTLATSDNYQSIAWNGRMLVAVGSNNACCTSTDGGNTWTSQTIPTVIGGTRYLWSVAWCGLAFVAVEFTTGTPNAALYASTDGLAWKANTLAMPSSGSGWRSVVWAGNGAVAIGTSAAAISALVAS